MGTVRRGLCRAALAGIALTAVTIGRPALPTPMSDGIGKEHGRMLVLLRGIITMPDEGVPPAVRGEAIRLAGYMRTTDEETIRYLSLRIKFTTLPNGGYVDYSRAATVFPTLQAIGEIGLPAVPQLVALMAKPLAVGETYLASDGHWARSVFESIVGHCGASIAEFAREATLDPAAAEALAASIEALPRARMTSCHEIMPRTFDLPEPYKLYTDPEELKQALLSEDDAVRHAALSGVLRTYKEHAKALTDLIAAEGPADLEVIEAIGQLRPRQEETVQALVSELVETVRRDPMDEKHEEALVTALARIGCPGVRACVKLLKTEEDKRAEKACVRVLWFALGQFGDDWLLAEAQYGDGHEEYAEKLTQVAERWKRLFKGGGIWNLS